MEHNKIIAIACAVIALILVVIAGKSCADDISKSNKRNKSTIASTVQASVGEIRTNAPQDSYQIQGNEDTSEDDEVVEYDLFGNVITTASESETKGEDETIFDEDTTVETDVFGEPVTNSGDFDDEEIIPEESTAPPVISGFNHGEYDEDGNTLPAKPTLPPDFTLVV